MLFFIVHIVWLDGLDLGLNISTLLLIFSPLTNRFSSARARIHLIFNFPHNCQERTQRQTPSREYQVHFCFSCREILKNKMLFSFKAIFTCGPIITACVCLCFCLPPPYVYINFSRCRTEAKRAKNEPIFRFSDFPIRTRYFVYIGNGCRSLPGALSTGPGRCVFHLFIILCILSIYLFYFIPSIHPSICPSSDCPSGSLPKPTYAHEF